VLLKILHNVYKLGLFWDVAPPRICDLCRPLKFSVLL